MGSQINEMFSVNEMEKDQKSFFVSTTPYNPQKQCDYYGGQGFYPYDQTYNPDAFSTTSSTPEQLVKDLKSAGRDQSKVANLMGNNPAHLIGIETKNTFNGTWGTDAKWHQIFYKDIKSHEMFTGQFEADKTIKFHENPVPENEHVACDGIDC
jgi:hypothetical protein